MREYKMTTVWTVSSNNLYRPRKMKYTAKLINDSGCVFDQIACNTQAEALKWSARRGTCRLRLEAVNERGERYIVKEIRKR